MKTTSLGLKKPEGTDLVNIQDMNDNMDVIEKELQARTKSNGEIKDTTVAFTQASSRANIATGEKMGTLMGKIKKWFADMTVAAFAQVITSNTDLMALTKSGYLVDALAVKNQFAEINGKLHKVIQCTYDGALSAGKNSIVAKNFASGKNIISISKIASATSITYDNGTAFIDSNGSLVYQPTTDASYSSIIIVVIYTDKQ